MAKEFARSFYTSRSWQQCRDAYISSVGGICEECEKRGVVKPGHIVHHIEHITPQNISDPYVTLSWDNLQYVCLECHNKIHYGSDPAREGLTFDERGDLVEEIPHYFPIF